MARPVSVRAPIRRLSRTYRGPTDAIRRSLKSRLVVGVIRVMVRNHLERLESGIIPDYRSVITVAAAGPVVVTVEE